jgi:hypothetical protein
MSKENVKAKPAKKVLVAVSKLTQELCFMGGMDELQEEMEEICDRLLESEHGNELHIRLKMLKCKEVIKMVSKTIDQFTFEEIMLQTNVFCNE